MSAQAKHRVIYKTLAEEIAEGVYPPGCCLPTETELAKRFGVARQTVLKALDALKLEGKLISVRGSGTFVTKDAAKGVYSSKDVRQIGFIAANLQESFGHQVFLGFEAEAVHRNYTVVAGNSDYDSLREGELMRRMHQQGVAACAIVPFFQNNRHLADQLHGTGWPMICIDNNYNIPGIPFVNTDNEQAGYNATAFLLAEGRRRIGFLVNAFDALQSVWSTRRRFEGYKRALADSGVPFRPELVQELGITLAARRPVEVGLDIYAYPAMHKMLHSCKGLDAVLLLWDELAPGALNAIRDSGLKVPEDIAVIGFNDDELCTLLTPQLTTIKQPARELGALAARQLIELIEGKDVAEETVLPNKMVFRASTCMIK